MAVPPLKYHRTEASVVGDDGAPVLVAVARRPDRCRLSRRPYPRAGEIRAMTDAPACAGDVAFISSSVGTPKAVGRYHLRFALSFAGGNTIRMRPANGWWHLHH